MAALIPDKGYVALAGCKCFFFNKNATGYIRNQGCHLQLMEPHFFTPIKQTKHHRRFARDFFAKSAYYAYFAPSSTAKHPFFVKENQ